MVIGILGGGVSGLALASFLGEDYEILEKNPECGGLCTTFNKNGFLYDIGGHIMFSKHKDILEFEVGLLGDNVEKRKRNNKIWYRKRFVKYPFENGLHALDKEEIFECLRDYFINKNPKPTNLKEWFYHNFGTSLADKYLLPYNEKIWKIDPAKLSMQWADRIPKPPAEDIIKSAIGIETEGYTHQLYFYYPKSGGFQSLVRAFESKLEHIYTSKEVKSVAKEKNKWTVETQNSSHEYDELVSTMSLIDLIKLLKKPLLPEEIVKAVKSLRYNSMAVVLVGINRVKHSDLTAIYVPDKESLAHRYCFSTGFSDNLCPKGCSSIFAEITYNPKDGIQGLNDTEVIEKTVSWLDQEGFIDKKDVCETDIKHIKYAYPVYDYDYDKNINIIYKYFDSIGLNLLGRFSQFIYINSDVCIFNAKKLAEKLNKVKK